MRRFVVGAAIWAVLLAGAGAQPPANPEALKALGRVRAEGYAAAGIRFDPNQSRAVLIGVNEFEDERLSPLRFAVDDAVDLAHRFWELGLIAPKNTTLLLSGAPVKPATQQRLAALTAAGLPKPLPATKSRALRSVREAADGAGPAGILLVSASTHGYYHNIDAILTQDSVLDLRLENGTLEETSLSHATLVGLVQGSGCPRKLMLLDACREKLTRTASIGGVSPLSDVAQQALANTKGMAVLTATTTGGFGFDGGKGLDGRPIENGLFTHYVLDALTYGTGNPADPQLTLGEVADAVDANVRAWTKARWKEERGIGRKDMEGDWAKLPLAENPEALAAAQQAAAEAKARADAQREIDRLAAMEKARREQQAAAALADRKKTARTNLMLAGANDDAIVALTPAVVQALNTWEGERLERLLSVLERLDPANEDSRIAFVDRRWKELAPTATPTLPPTAAPTPLPTQVATARPSPVPPTPAQQSSAPTAGERREFSLGGGQTLALVYVPPGTFSMGSPLDEPERGSDEGKEGPFKVRITAGFWMGETEITVGQFKRFIDATGSRTEAEEDGKGGTGWTGTTWSQDPKYTWRNPGFEQTDRHPVVNVSWNDARKFCAWASTTTGKTILLPTEAQWEYACRAGTSSTYFWGNNADDHARYANIADKTAKAQFSDWTTSNGQDGYVFTSPVKSFSANRAKLFDMTGNVWEWCSDFYGDYPTPGTSTVSDWVQTNEGASRVIRGGSWLHPPQIARSAYRSRVTPDNRFSRIGFRVSAPRI